MAVVSAISSPLGPASCDKGAKALQFIEETTRNADLVPRNADTEFPTSVNSDEAVSSMIRSNAFTSKAFHGLSKSLKKAVIKVGEPIYKALDFLLNRRRGGGGGGGGDDGDGEEDDVEGRGRDQNESRPTIEMLQLMATATIANTAQTFGAAISLKVGGLTFLTKILLILVMATGLAGYLFSITAILLMHKRPRFSHVLVWTGCAATTLGFLILIVAFVLEL